MIAEWIESNIIQVITLVAGIVYFASKVESSARASKEFFEAELKHVSNLISLNHQNLREELNRLKEKNAETTRELKEDIARLEKKSEEANHVRERVCLLEASAKSAHHRLDRLEDGIIEDDN